MAYLAARDIQFGKPVSSFINARDNAMQNALVQLQQAQAEQNALFQQQRLTAADQVAANQRAAAGQADESKQLYTYLSHLSRLKANPQQFNATAQRMLSDPLFQKHGITAEDLTPDQVDQALPMFAAQAGVGPVDSFEQVSGPRGAVMSRNTATGELKQVVGPDNTESPNYGQGKPPAGYRWGPSGSLEAITGGPADKTNQPSKPATEGDKRAQVMYRSMTNAEKQIEAVSGADTSNLGQAILGKIGGGKVLQTDEYKRYEAAGLRWAANLLYLKSGATATPEEINSTWRQFFPQIGDGPSVKSQKDEARSQEMSAINDAYSFGDSYVKPSPGGGTIPNGVAIHNVSKTGKPITSRDGGKTWEYD